MNRRGQCWSLVGVAAGAIAALAFADIEPTNAGARREALPSAPRVVTVASVTTREFRVAVVARQMSAGAAPTAEVRAAVARRVNGSWREIGETRFRETYFWHTVAGPRAVCRLEIATTSTARHLPTC
jgi:hypothetical protein